MVNDFQTAAMHRDTRCSMLVLHDSFPPPLDTSSVAQFRRGCLNCMHSKSQRSTTRKICTGTLLQNPWLGTDDDAESSWRRGGCVDLPHQALNLAYLYAQYVHVQLLLPLQTCFMSVHRPRAARRVLGSSWTCTWVRGCKLVDLAEHMTVSTA